MVLLLIPLTTYSHSVMQPLHDSVKRTSSSFTIQISEVLVSASSADYNGTDWNNDGIIGSSSDQFVELWNYGNEAVDISNWWLDDSIDTGSAPCTIAWNTTLEPDQRIVVFRADSRIEFDYYNDDAATLRDLEGNLVDRLEYPARDSWYDFSYVPLENGSIGKVSPPTPGWGEGESQPAILPIVGCYGLSDHIHQGGYILGGRIVLMTGEADVYNKGYIYVKDGMIENIWNSSIPENIELTNIPVIETNGSIYPGLLDLHNHLHYNQAPLWDMTPHLPEQNRNAWGGYNNRYEWKNHPDYSSQVTKPKMLVHSGPYWNMESQAMKYVEVKSIVGGTTAAQGSPSNPDESYSTILARNLEDWNFGRDEIHTKVTELTTDYQGNHIKNGNSSGTLDAWFVHIAEGVDSSSRAEFDILVNNNLLVGELVLIHGVALTSAEFEKMAEVGSTLVWSPLSNLLLYGQTADVAAAKEAGVRITLSPDWAPSGSKSSLHELKVADFWDDEMLGDIFTDYELVRMVTSDAAQATGWGNEVGTIREGNYADLVVVDNIHANPYRNLIDAIDPDIRLSIVGGLALYGDMDIMAELKGDDFEPAGAMNKGIDVTFISVPDGAQSWQEIVDDLEIAMQFDPAEMQSAFGDANDFENVISGMEYVGLDPWYTYGDERYFDVLNRSTTANAQVDMSKLYDRYYDREENIEFNQTFEIVELQPCPDNTLPPCQDSSTDNEDTPDSNVTEQQESNSTEKSEVVYPSEDASDEVSSKTSATVLFWGISITLLVGLYLFSASGKKEDDGIDLQQNVAIEELSEEGPEFIPAPPPLAPPPSD